jgi:protein gp37
MAATSAIEWTDATFNPWIGCTRVSTACDNCYAAVSTPARSLGVEWGAGQPRRRTSEANWKLPLRWNREDFQACSDCGWRGAIDSLEDDTCRNCGRHERLDSARRRVFCASLADVFDTEVAPQWRLDLFDLIRLTPNLDWLLLTKRVGNVQRALRMAGHQLSWTSGTPLHEWLANWLDGHPPSNVWVGATVCNQAEADRDIPKLLAVPAVVRFLSMEPLLGSVDLRLTRDAIASDRLGLHWVIAGGESGNGVRPMHPGWARSIRDQCVGAGVPFLFKQWGEWVSVSEVAGPGDHFRFPDGATVRRTGKKLAGRTLDGRTHDEYPKPLSAFGVRD